VGHGVVEPAVHVAHPDQSAADQEGAIQGLAGLNRSLGEQPPVVFRRLSEGPVLLLLLRPVECIPAGDLQVGHLFERLLDFPAARQTIHDLPGPDRGHPHVHHHGLSVHVDDIGLGDQCRDGESDQAPSCRQGSTKSGHLSEHPLTE